MRTFMRKVEHFSFISRFFRMNKIPSSSFHTTFFLWVLTQPFWCQSQRIKLQRTQKETGLRKCLNLPINNVVFMKSCSDILPRKHIDASFPLFAKVQLQVSSFTSYSVCRRGLYKWLLFIERKSRRKVSVKSFPPPSRNFRIRSEFII